MCQCEVKYGFWWPLCKNCISAMAWSPNRVKEKKKKSMTHPLLFIGRMLLVKCGAITENSIIFSVTSLQSLPGSSRVHFSFIWTVGQLTTRVNSLGLGQLSILLIIWKNHVPFRFRKRGPIQWHIGVMHPRHVTCSVLDTILRWLCVVESHELWQLS